jgi:hypothetical protein
MKKLLITTAATLITVAAFAQGTVFFSNSGFEKVSSGVAGSAASTWAFVPATAGLINYGLFYGTGATQPGTLTFLGSVSGVNSTSTAGVIASPLDGVSSISILGIPGTVGNQANVWVQIAGWTASFGTDWAAAKAAAATTAGDYFGQTAVVNALPLGAPVTGPGTPLWQFASGTNPQQFAGGFALFSGGGAVTPEPSTMALAGLGMAAMLIFRRRK